MNRTARTLLALCLAGAATYACMLLALAPVAHRFRSPFLRKIFLG